MYIFVLESLRKSDPKTGDEIHKFLEQENIPNEFHVFRSKKELIDLLELVKIRAAADKIHPYVHFDCHGNNDGIAAIRPDATEEFISWEDILDQFIDIYQAAQKKSVICMSSCEGFNASKMVAKGKPCPYDFVCGSFEKIGFNDAYQAFSRFYKDVASGTSVSDAALKIHNAPDLKHINFISVNSQKLFRITLDGYIADQLTAEKLSQRKAYLLDILMKNGYPYPTKVQLDYLDKACSIEGQRRILDRFEKIFFSFK